ncbi:MAG: type VI secretion system Vgr family protein [Bryobacteraceae bacterium]
MVYTQVNRRIAIETPLGPDALLLRSFQGREAISRIFQFDLDLLSEKDSIPFDDVVGQRVTLKVLLADGSPRYWSGFLARFSQAGRDQNLARYHAVMVPWLWFLTRTTDCRIFQQKKAPEIIQQIFKDLGFSDYSLRLYGDFVQREYCVQYRETDFNFVARLMEEEGIYYFFEHEEGKHTMVLANDPSAHKPCPNQPSARYELSAGGWQDDDVVLEWHQEQEFRPGVYTSTDYNFETPGSSLAASVNGKSKYEIYDYPGEYRKRSEGDGLVRIRLQEQEMARVIARGSSDCRAFTAGYRFDLKDHYRADLNKPYVLTALNHSAAQGANYASGNGAEPELTYSNTFECIPHSTPFRPPRVTPAPIVQGCQTAVVVGPAGEEIYTDKYGRVKVQFHWDREGKRDEKSSCWIRVSQPWAGKGWGSVSIPRIGQEVIVDFLEGDPDQPIITGKVYNAEQMPPYDLPHGAVVSGLKSHSTKGGGGYNEMSMDDTKHKEKITIHGQYDMGTTIEHDLHETVLNDRTRNVTRDEKITIGRNVLRTVEGEEKTFVNNKQVFYIQHGRVMQVSNGGETYVVFGGREKTVYDHETKKVNGPMTEEVTGLVTTNSTGAAVHIYAATEILLQCGSSSLLMKSDGTIELSGKDIKITGGNTVQMVVSSQSVTCNTSKVITSGAGISSTAMGTHDISGALIKIN